MDEKRTNTGIGTPRASDRRTSTEFGESNRGVTSATETCDHCGQPLNQSLGLEQFLGRIGISEDMINNLKTQMQDVDFDEYLNIARDYLKNAGDKVKPAAEKAQRFAKENPGKVVAGLAVLAVGAGLLINSLREHD